MKKAILTIVILIYACHFTYATEKTTDKVDKPVSLSEELSAYIAQSESMSTKLKSIQSEIDKLKKDNKDFNERNSILEEEIKNIGKLLTDKRNFEMLVMYPLIVQYDTALVNYSLKVITTFTIDKEKENTEFAKVMLPVLKNYNKYNECVYKFISDIKKSSCAQSKGTCTISIEMFESLYKKTDYYKDCFNKARNIPYLDEKIQCVRDLINKKEMTSQKLQSILDDLK